MRSKKLDQIQQLRAAKSAEETNRLKGRSSSVQPNKYMLRIQPNKYMSKMLILKGKKGLKIRIFSGQLKKYVLLGKNKYILERLMLKGKNWRLKVEDEDKLSKLPDEIVESIMSWMTTEEAARMSVVSRQWHRIWKSAIRIMPRLTLDVDSNFAKQLSDGNGKLAKQLPIQELRGCRDKCINEVNQVLKLHKAPTLDEFSLLASELVSEDTHHIKTWLDFAAKKHVKNLTLHLHPLIRYDATFLLADNFRCLRDLHMDGLYVTENVIHRLFSNSPFLERFSLLHSYQLDKLKIVYAPNLKYLKVSNNKDLRHLEFSSANNVLNTIEIKGDFPLQTVNICSAPNLSHLILGIQSRRFKFDPYLTLLKQIKRLTLQISVSTKNFMILDKSLQFLQFCKFEHLELIMGPGSEMPIHCLLVVLRAAVFLNTFSVEFYKFAHPTKDNGLKLLYKHMPSKVKVNGKHSCQRLKVLKLNSFAGCQSEVEFVLHLLEYAVSMEKIIIHLMPSSVWRNRDSWWEYEDKFDNQYEVFCLGCAQLLKTKIGKMHPEADVIIKF